MSGIFDGDIFDSNIFDIEQNIITSVGGSGGRGRIRIRDRLKNKLKADEERKGKLIDEIFAEVEEKVEEIAVEVEQEVREVAGVDPVTVMCQFHTPPKKTTQDVIVVNLKPVDKLTEQIEDNALRREVHQIITDRFDELVHEIREEQRQREEDEEDNEALAILLALTH